MTKLEEIKKDFTGDLFDKYRELIAFMEITKLNVKAVINFLYINYDRIEVSQDAFEEDNND